MDPKPYMLNVADVPWVPYAHGRFASEDKPVTDALSASRLSAVITRLPAGAVSCPYHFHRVGEELFIVLEGAGTLRYNGETRPVGPGDVIACPPGPGSAHQFQAGPDGPLVYWAISTAEAHEICEYPDSGKVLAWAKNDGERQRWLFKAADGHVDYFEGEEV